MDRRHLLLGLALALAACTAAPSPTTAPTAALLSLPPASATAPAGSGPTPGPAATPVIIASATATATPVTHVVQAGETMLGVAIQFGVSLDALQAANPNIQPRFLSVGTVLVIPPPEGGFAVAATNLAPPPPAPVDLTQPVCYTIPSGALYCFVDARNPNNRQLENVSARIILAGPDGLPFASQTAFGALDLIPPASAVPLAALFTPAPTQTVAATGVELLTANLAAEPPPAGGTVMLGVSAQPGAVLGGQWMVSGHVTNPTTQALTSAWVLLAVYDAQGHLGGFRKLALDNGLAAGETRPFTISSDSLAGAVDHDLLLAEGRP
jgi:LysM repeat protein